jgi:hypothetical protein
LDRRGSAQRVRKKCAASVSKNREQGLGAPEIVVLAEDNHLNILAKTGVRTGCAGLNRFDAEYFKTRNAYFTPAVQASSAAP